MTRAAVTAAAAGAVLSHRNGGLWWRHAHGGYGWVGPVFWPYAYYDVSDYAWWGGSYDPLFWDYGYGDLYAGLFGPYDYDALSGYAGYLPGYAGPRQASNTSGATAGGTATATVADMCGSDTSDIAGFPIDQFRAAIQPNSEQSAALDELANASQKASETIRASCPKDVALTAPSRLDAMKQRIQAMLDAVNTLKPALDKFYGLLNDDQKAKVTALAADQRPQHQDAAGGACNAAQPTATMWPDNLIERNVKPTDAQQTNLKALKDATTKAEDMLKGCPPSDARTPPARLDAVQTRLNTILQAIGTVQPALDSFYGSLNDEQKAAFDAIGPEHKDAKAAANGGEEGPRHHHHRHHYRYSVRGAILRMMGL